MGNKINLHKRCIGIAMFLLLVFGVIKSLKAQQYVQQVFDYSNTREEASDFIRNPDNSYYLLSTIREDTAQFNKMLLTKTDSLFNPIWSKIYYNDSTSHNGQNIISLPDTTTILNGFCFYSNYHLTQRLIKIDANGDTIWTNEIGNSAHITYFNYLGVSGDTLFLFGSYSDHNIDYNSIGLIVGVNKNTGALLISKTYVLSSHYNTYFKKAVEKKSGSQTKFYILGFSLIDTVDYKTTCFITETESSLTNEKVVIISDSAATYQDVPNIDVSEVSNKILVGYTTNDLIGSGPKYCFAEFDDQLNLQWAKRFWGPQGNADFVNLKFYGPNDNIYGSLAYTIYHFDSIGSILDKKNGYYNQLLQINSGNFVNSVFYNQKISWFGTIRRGPSNTDTNLLITTTNDTGAGCYDINLPLPNEGVYQLTPYIDSSLTINNIILNSNFGINYSSANVTIIIECLTSNIENNRTSVERPFIYPNPTHDKFAIKGISINSLYNISIYNSLGVLIRVFPQNDLANETIDLNGFCSGVYFLKIINSNGFLYSLKLLKI